MLRRVVPRPADPREDRTIPAPNPAGGRVAGVGDQAVRRATGRGWAEWLRVIDRAGGRRRPHREIAAWLGAEHGLSAWWRQMVTVGYEQARGLRAAHQTTSGFQGSVSRTLAAARREVFAAWAEPRRRARWLRAKPALRGTRTGRDLRFTWSDGTDVQVRLVSRTPGRTQVVVQHRKLARAAQVRRMRTWWAAALERLRAQVETSD
jgi:hypothetical protein